MDLSKLNDPQKTAVTHADGPLLIVAGAGTGKTTVLTHRVAWLIEQGLAKPDEILCLTFTDKAAGEMEERIDKLLPYGYVDLWVMTFHAFAERLLKQHGLHIGLPLDFRILDQTGQWMLLHDQFDHLNLDYYKPLGNPTKFIAPLLTHFSRAKDEGIRSDAYTAFAQSLQASPSSKPYKSFRAALDQKIDDEKAMELWKEEIAKTKELAGAYDAYQQLLYQEQALDFGDLILSVLELLQKRQNILEQYRRQFKYILVDEFQDTNWAQYALLRLLAEPRNNITVVGDDDQSIYKFRGASLSNILGFKQDYPKAAQVVLSDNYRSTQDILDLAYRFIQHNNPHRLEFQLSEAEDVAEAAGQKQMDLSGFRAINKQLISHRSEKGMIEHLHFSSLRDEAVGVVEKIVELRQADPTLTWGDFAILVRANSSAEPFLQQLTVSEIPYQFLASQGLFAQPEVVDILSYLKLLDNYAESTALYRLLVLPTVDISNEDLMTLLHHADRQAVSLREAMKESPNLALTTKGKELCESLLDRIDTHATLARKASVSETAMAFIEDYGLRQYYEKLPPLVQKDTYSLLNHFWKFMQGFESQAEDKTAKAFLTYVELAKQAGDSGALPQDLEVGPDTVKVMTVHGAKGLEFRHVFIVSLVDRRFPTTERKDPLPIPDEFIHELQAGADHHLEEERRLFYVALTRAKEGLFLTSAEDYGGVRKKKLSRFLFELGFEPKEAIKLSSNEPFLAQVKKNPQKKRDEEIDYTRYLPKTFSHTQLKTFQTCPWKYKYAFVLKIPVRGKHSFSFGKSMHGALEAFFNQALEHKASGAGSPYPSKAELLKMYEESWIGEWYTSEKQKQEQYEKGKEMLASFYQLHEGKWPEVEANEKAFTLKIGEYSLRGSIDRVDRLPNGVRLVDYKTGSVPKTDRALDKDQLTIYQIAAEEIFGETVEELTYYYLNGNIEKSFLANEKQKEKLKEKVIQTLDELNTSRFEPKPSQINCASCEYASICPYAMI